jgi:non-ribosomal peptide synthetase-like protein
VRRKQQGCLTTDIDAKGGYALKTFIDRLLRNPISFEITSIFVYAFYCFVFATAAVPSAFLISWGTRFLDGSYLMLCLFTVICFLAFYVFLVVSAIVVGTVERLLTLGFKPGAYPPGSPVFFRWLIYSGLHLWMVYLVLPFLRGNNWIKVYMRVAGAKVGKETFINTKDIFDTYLLEIGNDVLVGGEAFLNCHLFENGHLNLGKIIIGDGTTIGANAYLTPGTRTGKNSTVGMYTYLRRNTDVHDGEALVTPPGMSARQVVRLMRSQEKH